MDKLTALRTFVNVAECGSFTAAARRLGCSVSAATKGVARLEDELGTRLINRTTRQVALTPAGEGFFGRVAGLIAELELAERSLREASSTAQGAVRLVLPLLFGRRTLLPSLPAFYKRYPGIELQLNFSDRPVDLVEAGFDVAVHTGEMRDSGIVARRLTQGPQVTAASPAYLAAFGAPQTPDDLHRHNCIYGRFGPDWTFRTMNGGRRKITVGGNLVVFSGDALCEAAVHGVGIVHATWWALQHDLRAGRLEEVLAPFTVMGPPISVVFPAKKHLPTKVRVVVDHLVEICKPAAQEESVARRNRPAPKLTL